MAVSVGREAVYLKIRVLSNKRRFKIIELTQQTPMNITTLSSALKLSYTKCADYVTLLEKAGLVKKTKVGKEILVSSLAAIKENRVEFDG